MSFFKEFKEDLSRAMNELLPDDHSGEDDTDEQMVNTLEQNDADQASDNEKMMELLDTFTSDATNELNDSAEFTNPEKLYNSVESENSWEEAYSEGEEGLSLEADPEGDVSEELSMEDTEDLKDNISLEIIEEEGEDMDENIDLELLDVLNAEEELEQTDESNEKAVPKLRAAAVANDDEVTVISKGTTINGSISSEGSLDIMGTITGDIECLGKLSITGKVNGNSTAAEVYVNTERMEGGINSEGSVKVGLGTVIIGDIVATSGVIAGAVKGEIDVNGPIVIDSTAIIKGNIKAKSVQINNGAVIEGFCSLSYSSVDVDNIFE